MSKQQSSPDPRSSRTPSARSQQSPVPAYRPDPEFTPGASLFPPWWSILLTLVLVVFCAGTLVLLVVELGGNAAPPAAPRLLVLTAAPVDTFISEALVMVTPTLSADVTRTQSPISFVMAGPTLPPPPITPTAISVSLGATIRVVDVGDQQLNVRERAGVQDIEVKFRAPENTLFVIVDGPTQADGLTWWKIQDPDDSRRSGWAASNYLEVVPTVTP